MNRIEEDTLSRNVIGCAFDVNNQMGFGFLESVYENCLAILFTRKGLAFERQKALTVTFNGQIGGDFIADFLVEDSLLLELKTVQVLHPVHEAQLVNYLAATGIDRGLLINFGPGKVDIRRKWREYTPTVNA